MEWLKDFFLKKDISPKKDQEKLPEERPKVVVLMDFENLVESAKDDPEQKRVGQFLDYVSFQEGKDIIFFEIFTPSHRAANAESVLFSLYSANIIHMPKNCIPVLNKCPRNFLVKFRNVRENGKKELRGNLKDVDQVDYRMVARGKTFVDHIKGLAEIIIISNDGDFRDLRSYAYQRGVKCRVFPVSRAFSKDYSRLNEDPVIFLNEGGEKSEK